MFLTNLKSIEIVLIKNLSKENILFTFIFHLGYIWVINYFPFLNLNNSSIRRGSESSCLILLSL